MDQVISRKLAGSDEEEAPRLREVPTFGSNPGNLRMHIFEPTKHPRRRPCVVVLHGCTQTAAGYDAGSGWSCLAEELGFYLIYPEQQHSNNDNACFSWFSPEKTTRGCGEVESIRQMIDVASGDLDLDRDAIFICGLSAGGAMAVAMMAAHPEMFAGGAVIAGLPYGAATSMSEAFQAMFIGGSRDARRWGDVVREASDHTGSWPAISIWYGTDDHVVKPINAGELVKQWTNVHGVGAESPVEDQIGPASRRSWLDATGHPRVRSYMLPNVGHGAPVDDRSPPAPFFLPVGLSSTQQIAADFGLFDRLKPHGLLSLIGR